MGAGHIFVSYNSADMPFADEMVHALESAGLRVWYAPGSVRPGIDYSEQIQKAIETASAFVVIISEAANQSDFVRAETEMAFSCRRPIFPVRTSPIMPAPGLALFLNLRHWTNAFGPGRRGVINRLCDELVSTVRHPAGSRRRGATLFRPRLRGAVGALSSKAGTHSHAPAILAALGVGALVLAVALAIPSESQADLQANEMAAANASGGATGNVSPPRPGEPDYDRLLENWTRYTQDTAPPPENLIDDTINMDMGMDANIAVPDGTGEVNGM